MAPRLAEFDSTIRQNGALFDRIRAIYEGDDLSTLRPDQQRLVQLVYDGFARNGATLEGDSKARYAEIEQRLAELHSAFSNNVLADEEGYVTYLSEAQLNGLPPSFVQAAAAAATGTIVAARTRPAAFELSPAALSPLPPPVSRWLPLEATHSPSGPASSLYSRRPEPITPTIG